MQILNRPRASTLRATTGELFSELADIVISVKHSGKDISKLNHRYTLGNALITALFIMVLIAITATAMVKRISVDIARTQRFTQTDQFYLAAQLAQFWSMSQLATWEQPMPMPNQQGKILKMPKKFQKLCPGFHVQGYIYDLQDRLNLNTITYPPMQAIFLRLTQSILPLTSTQFIKSIIEATQDWISPPDIGNGNKWSQYYANLSHPYLAAHQPMKSVFEFNRVAGVTPEIFKKSYKHLTALPDFTKINLNTASPTLLRLLSEKIEESVLDELLTLRTEKGIQSTQQFNEIVQKLNLNPLTVCFESQYFLSVAIVTKNKRIYTLNTILKREKTNPDQINANQKWYVTIVSQTIT